MLSRKFAGAALIIMLAVTPAMAQEGKKTPPVVKPPPPVVVPKTDSKGKDTPRPEFKRATTKTAIP